jgi:hypothetical protein
MLVCQGIMLRLASVALLIATLSACTFPRTALVLGGATTIVGGAMIASIEPVKPQSCQGATVFCPPDIGGTFQSASNGLGYLLGGIVVATGVSLMLSGAVGLAQEYAREQPAPPPLAPLAATHTLGMGLLPVPTSSSTATTAVAVPASDPRAVLMIRARAATRIGRCDVAVHAAEQLEKLDAAMYAELIENDERVEHCVARSRR